jgi:hypothetical protein
MTTLTALKAPVQPINHAAVVDAAMRAIHSAYGHEGVDYHAFVQAVRDNIEAKGELDDCLWLGSEEDDGIRAFALGMLAGMLYAQATGNKIPVPPLPDFGATSASDAPQVS